MSNSKDITFKEKQKSTAKEPSDVSLNVRKTPRKLEKKVTIAKKCRESGYFLLVQHNSGTYQRKITEINFFLLLLLLLLFLLLCFLLLHLLLLLLLYINGTSQPFVSPLSPPAELECEQPVRIIQNENQPKINFKKRNKDETMMETPNNSYLSFKPLKL